MSPAQPLTQAPPDGEPVAEAPPRAAPYRRRPASEAPPRRRAAPGAVPAGGRSLAPPPHPGPVVWGVIALTCAVEALLLAADAGLVGTRGLRALAYNNGGFYPGLLGNWRPNYAAQPWAMFLTYALLHGGPGHLAGNMITLVSLGGVARARAGSGGFLALYVVSALGGAAAFAVMGRPTDLMVGASGALFGLAGAWLRWDLADRRAEGRRALPVAWLALGLVALNVVMWVALDGLLAWQTHLGGAVAGWLVAGVIGRRPTRSPAGRAGRGSDT